MEPQSTLRRFVSELVTHPLPWIEAPHEDDREGVLASFRYALRLTKRSGTMTEEHRVLDSKIGLQGLIAGFAVSTSIQNT